MDPERSPGEAAPSGAERVIRGADIDLAALEGAGATPARRVRVLVVDDDPTIRDVLRILLTVEFTDQVEIRCTASGHEALGAVGWAPDVAVIDWMMPAMDGLETCRHLRREVPGARLIMYSSRLAAEGEPEALEAGADRYIEKGADTAALIDDVRSAMAASIHLISH